MLFNRINFQLQEVDFVGGFVNNQALTFDLVQHLLIHHAFQGFDLFITTKMLTMKVYTYISETFVIILANVVELVDEEMVLGREEVLLLSQAFSSEISRDCRRRATFNLNS